MKLKVKPTRPDALLPFYATEGAACFDLRVPTAELTKQVFAGESEIFPTGLCFEVPEGHVMLVFSRSGHGFNSGVRLANCVGVIDSDYRGEVKVKLTNDGDDSFHVQLGDRIAQAMVIPVQQVDFEVVDELSSTTRGSNGFGSTGT